VVSPVLAPTYPFALTEVPSDYHEVEGVTYGVNVLSFELDPGGGPLCRLVWGIHPLDHDPLLIPVNGLVELLEDLLNREALFAPDDLEHVRHLLDHPGQHDLPVLQPRTHQVDLLGVVTVRFDVQDVEDHVTDLQVRVTILVIVGVSGGDFLVQTERSNLLLLVVPHDHLPIKDASLSIHVVLDVLRYLRAIDPRVVVGVPREELDDAVLHVALDALPVKLGLY
jgi:hypothetical protein